LPCRGDARVPKQRQEEEDASVRLGETPLSLPSGVGRIADRLCHIIVEDHQFTRANVIACSVDRVIVNVGSQPSPLSYTLVGPGGAADSTSERPGLTIVKPTNVGFLCFSTIGPPNPSVAKWILLRSG
jgi:hypothetical protein